jgi:uncharacterized protein
MRVAVTGSSGLIGSALLDGLKSAGHEPIRVVRREPHRPGEVQWDPARGTIDTAALGAVDAIVNLAGEPLDRRWTDSRKREILESRVQSTRLAAATAAAADPQPALLCASATGFYGDRGDEELTERSSRGTGFLADVVEAWEAAAQPARDAGVRVVQFRQGLVLSRGGGVLGRMLLPFRLGLGGRVGSGRQWWSWVSLDDVVKAYVLAVDRPLEGTFNVTAPGVVRSIDFVHALGRALRRPTVLPLPALAVRLVFGQMGEEILLAGQRALPQRLLAEGFEFDHAELEGALERALRTRA